MSTSTAVWAGRAQRSAALLALVFFLVMVPAFAQTKRSCADIEAFMRTGKITVTGGIRAVMDDGIIQHRVFLHTSDEGYSPDRFRDTWKAAVAGYELARILQVNIFPPQVEIKLDGLPASASWGLDDVLMDEAQRTKRNVQPPDLDAFNRQMHIVHIFDELFYVGHAPTDLLITKDWQLWVLTPSQGFTPNQTLRNPGNLVKSDRKLLDRMRTLQQATLASKLGNWLTREEIEALYARKTRIVAFFDREIASKGEASVLFDLDRSGPSCAL